MDEEDNLCGECNGEEFIPCWNCGGNGNEIFEDEEEACVECGGTGLNICDMCCEED